MYLNPLQRDLVQIFFGNLSLYFLKHLFYVIWRTGMKPTWIPSTVNTSSVWGDMNLWHQFGLGGIRTCDTSSIWVGFEPMTLVWFGWDSNLIPVRFGWDTNLWHQFGFGGITNLWHQFSLGGFEPMTPVRFGWDSNLWPPCPPATPKLYHCDMGTNRDNWFKWLYHYTLPNQT